MGNLTDRTIKAAKCPEGLNQTDLPDGQILGLVLRVYRSGAKRWALHYRRREDDRRHAALPADAEERRLDARLAGMAARLGAVYTRYADDITISLPEEDGNGDWTIRSGPPLPPRIFMGSATMVNPRGGSLSRRSCRRFKATFRLV